MTDKIRRALVSVSDKTGLVEFGKFLAGLGVEILSTGGSAKAFKDAGVPVTEVSAFTGFPEIMDGRVKTLQPKIHGGLLAVRGNAAHEKEMREHGIQPIDLLAVNLYPFEAAVGRGAAFEDCIENIDIGGPALIRAAAKNHAFVTVLVDPADYAEAMNEMQANDGATTPEFRRRLAAAAYARTAAYDAAIGSWFAGALGETFPRRIAFAGELRQRLRYGENPHQEAAFYVGGAARLGVATARQLQG
ncbi:MAG: bifunctional phosphoribosylaminoimidazolecarboxamide formyltransferase/IMP cyclohydrolase, partial [Pseudomonadota bacterium]